MAETKFTPGPWESSFTDCLGGPASYCRIRPESEEMFGHFTSMEIATMCMMDEAEQQANAHLIAAAPELYEALNSVVRHFDEWARDADTSSIEDAESHLTWLEPARDALAKARGEA